MFIQKYESPNSDKKSDQNNFIILHITNITLSVIYQVGLPLFLASLGGNPGVYFAILWYNILFNLIAWPAVLFKYLYGSITPKMIRYTKRQHFKLVLLGLFEAIYEILNWYASSLSRTPGSLQSILSSSVLPFTFVLSHCFLRKRYSTERLMGIIVTFLGITVSLIPNIHNFNTDITNILWPIIFLLSDVFLVLTNITQEKIFTESKGFDSILIMAWQTFYTLLTVLVFFWVDILPWFGTSENLYVLFDRLWEGTKCFFTPWRMASDTCDYCITTGVIYGLAYVLNTYCEAELIKKAKTQTITLISAITPSLAVFFWLIFPGLNSWAQGKQYSNLDIICYVVSLPIIAVGVFIAPTYSYYMYDMNIYIYYSS
jgi:uncharacterized membrane protein